MASFEQLELKPHGLFPSPRQVEWYERELSAFFHFTVNTYTDMEWGDGTENPAVFNPAELDCRQWVRAVKDAGFKVAILTAKHHDGFCLWPSAYTEHSVKNSPYRGGKGDVVREFTDACREYGIGAGIYLSPWDRHEPTWGQEEYNDYYCAQLKELLTNYGPIAEIWWDGAGSETAHYDWGRWACVIRDLQPQCVIFGPEKIAPCADTRWVGNEGGFAGDPCWATINVGTLASPKPVTTVDLNHGHRDGDTFMPAETDVSIRPGWFYHVYQDKDIKSPSRLVTLWFDSVGKNTGLLLNLPPMPSGKLHPTDCGNLLTAHRLLTEAFANNLASGAAVQAPLRDTACAPEMMLCPDKDLFYAAPEGDTTPTVTFLFPTPQTVNCFRLGEKIELGHRVRRFAIDLLENGEWRTLHEGQSIGYLWADRFPETTAQGARIRVLEADCAPVLREFGLYRLSPDAYAEENALRESRELTAMDGVTVLREGKTTTVRLGGVYPYNTAVFDSLGAFSYVIEAFNGTTWEKVKDGRPGSREIARFPVVENSYQMRITLGKGGTEGDIHPKLYFQADE